MYYLRLVKLTSDERKTLTKISTRKTSHNHSPNQRTPRTTQTQNANSRLKRRKSCLQVQIAQIPCSSQELWAKCMKSGRFAGISESSLPMVRNLKALVYSGSINSANFISFAGFWGELHEICMIRWKFAEHKILLVILKTKKQMCTVKPCYILAKRLGLFAVRLPSLSWREMDWGCGITLDIFTHVCTGLSSFNILLI